MSIALRPIKTDDWLMRWEERDATVFPLKEILAGSLFYPAAGVDHDPVTYLKGYTTSFVYCDYGIEQKQVDEQRMLGWFDGYHVIHQRMLRREEIAPAGFRMPQLSEADPDPERFAAHRKPEFVLWFVFERGDLAHAADSPRRFSLLYVCADGVAAFNELYVACRRKPAAIAIIQPGHCFGANYTNFESPNEILARLVLENRAGPPDVLMFGGNQDEAHYSKACWRRYSRLIARPKRTSQPGYLGIWTRRLRV